MYQCNIRIYAAECPKYILDIITKIPPLEHFGHFFDTSRQFDPACAQQADLILAGTDLNAKEVISFAHAMRPEQQIIFLCSAPASADKIVPDKAADIWLLPLNDALVRFYFSRWQKNYKLAMDLKEKDLFLESLMATSPNLIWFKDKKGIHELVNDSFCKVVNKSRQQVQGRGHAYIWNVEKDDPACIESERIVMESGITNVSEEKITTGDGSRLLTVYKSPLRWNDDSMLGTVGMALDVTQEREYQEHLLQNNATLEMILSTMDCGMLRHSLDGKRVISANNTALKLLGYKTREELEAGFKTVAETVFEEDKDKMRSAIHQLKKVGDSSNYEYRVLHQDGTVYYIMGNAKLVEMDGEIICQRFLLDCTAQKMAAERKQIEREKRQRGLVRALCVDYQLVYVFDEKEHDGTILQLKDFPDKRLKDILSSKLPLRERLAQYIQECVHPDDRLACENAFNLATLKETLSNKKIHYFNYRAKNGDDVHYFQFKAVRASAPTDSFAVVVGLQSVDSRTRYEMEQKNQLSEALKDAKKASNAKTIFLSNMSHDIRTPMNAVLGYTTLALKHLYQPEQMVTYLKKIQSSGNHLISLINDILDMSHIESGKINLDEKLWNLTEIMKELWNIMQPCADEKGQHLILEMDTIKNANIYCDKLRLKQILLNLLSNAVKYTANSGQISMHVTQTPCSLQDHFIYEFRLTDNGIGMSEDFLKRLFEPFERAHASVVSGIQGTGLGMAITKNIVNMMHGTLEVQSKLDVGTEFTLRLPFRYADAQDSDFSTAPLPISQINVAETPNLLNGFHILLAEDNEMNQEIACEFLTSAGYTVDVACNGKEAVEKIKTSKPGYYDLVLMDVQMPILDGYEATGMIRALEDTRLAQVPIIAMTANSFEEDRQQAMRSGMDGHIAKPIDFNVLFKTIDSFLSPKE